MTSSAGRIAWAPTALIASGEFPGVVTARACRRTIGRGSGGPRARPPRRTPRLDGDHDLDRLARRARWDEAGVPGIVGLAVYWAVPVLPYTCSGKLPITSADVPPGCEAAARRPRGSVPVERVDATCRRARVDELQHVPSALLDVKPQVRGDDVPSLAIAEYATASWSGVTWTSPWPTARFSLSPADHGRFVPSASPQPPGGCFGCGASLSFRDVAPLVYLKGRTRCRTGTRAVAPRPPAGVGRVPARSPPRSIPVAADPESRAHFWSGPPLGAGGWSARRGCRRSRRRRP